jgi:MFS family permease
MFFGFHHTINKHERPFLRQPAIKQGLLALVAHKQLSHLASTLFGLFLPIFLFEFFGYRLWAPLLYGAAYYFLAFIFEPLGAKLMTKIGLKKSMMIGEILYLCFITSLLLKDFFPFWVAAILSLFFYVSQHVVYWVPFHTAFAESAPRQKLGSVLGIMAAITSVVGVVIPFLSAWIITLWGYNFLLFLAAVMAAFSLVPIFLVSTIEEKFEFGFSETFKILFSKKERPLLVLYASEGAENAVGFLVWPLFIFLLVGGKYLEVGALATALVVVSVLLQILVGRLSDNWNPQKIFRWGAGLNSLGWLARMFVNTAAQVFFVGVFQSLAAILMNTPFEAIMYTRAADAGHFVDEYTVLREMALGFGRTIVLVASAILVLVFGFPAAFFLAAAATLIFGAAIKLQLKKSFDF